MPGISRSTRSSGLTTRLRTSAGLAPCMRTNTLAAGTSICGFSSRGVMNSATTPTRKISRLMIGVRLVFIAAAPKRPAMFSLGDGSDCLRSAIAQRASASFMPVASFAPQAMRSPS